MEDTAVSRPARPPLPAAPPACPLRSADTSDTRAAIVVEPVEALGLEVVSKKHAPAPELGAKAGEASGAQRQRQPGSQDAARAARAAAVPAPRPTGRSAQVEQAAGSGAQTSLPSAAATLSDGSARGGGSVGQQPKRGRRKRSAEEDPQKTRRLEQGSQGAASDRIAVPSSKRRRQVPESRAARLGSAGPSEAASFEARTRLQQARRGEVGATSPPQRVNAKEEGGMQRRQVASEQAPELQEQGDSAQGWGVRLWNVLDRIVFHRT